MIIKLREIRVNKKLTIKELSKASSISVGHISEIENERTDVTATMICKLCKALNIEPNELLNKEYWS